VGERADGQRVSRRADADGAAQGEYTALQASDPGAGSTSKPPLTTKPTVTALLTVPRPGRCFSGIHASRPGSPRAARPGRRQVN
jgi:hypothetical protein